MESGSSHCYLVIIFPQKANTVETMELYLEKCCPDNYDYINLDMNLAGICRVPP